MTEVRLSHGGWAVGDRFSVVDAYLMVFWFWANGPALRFDMAGRFPAWTSHARRVAERPAVQAVFAREGLPLPR